MKNFHNRWQQIEKIHQGGQGEIYKVRDLKTDKYYAIKIFKFKKYQKEKLERVKSEINIIKKIQSKFNIVQIYDDNLDEAIKNKETEIFYVLDFSPYGSLLNNNFYFNDIELTLKLFKEILIGVNNAHKAGVIHRDLKPGNIIFYPNQREIMIVDFGISLLKDRKGDEITNKDEILGPQNFISPEQFKNPSSVDEKSDIYSLGKILFYMLTGQIKMYREQLEDLTSIFKESNPYIPLIQENLIEKMVVENKNKRFSDIETILDEVNSILDIIKNNSKRFVKTTENNYFFSFINGPERNKLVNEFSKKISRSLLILEIISYRLIETKKERTLEKLESDLLNKYTKGKVNIAIKSCIAYVSNPKELKNLDKISIHYSYPSYYLSKYFFDANSFSNSHKYIKKAISLEKDELVKKEYILFLSNICKECDCSEFKHDFEEEVSEIINKSSSAEEKTNLFKILGEYYLSIDKKQIGLMFLECYLDSEPYDHDIRFKCGYEYDLLNNYELSFFHYLTYLNLLDPKEKSTAINNLGWLYENNNMPISSMKEYEESYKLGNILAGSNIASRYLSIGLKDKALDILRKIIAENKDGYPSRVDEIFGKIPSIIKDEDAKKDKMREQGELLNKHNIAYIKELTNYVLYDWNGFWEINHKYVIEIKNNIIVPIKKSEINIIGLFSKNCFEITKLELDGPSYMNQKNYDKGYLYFKNRNNFKGYALNDKNETLELSGKRIDDLNKYLEEHKSPFEALLESIKINPK